MVKCLVKETCFYNGKRYRKGDHVEFQGKSTDAPKYLEPVKKSPPQAQDK